jgi:hypothetical protein
MTRRTLFAALASLPLVGRLVHAKPKRAPIIIGVSPADSATFTAAQTKATSCEMVNVDDMTDEQYADARRHAELMTRQWPRGLSYDGFESSKHRGTWNMPGGRIYHWDDIPVTRVVVDSYCPVGQVHCARGTAMVNVRNAPPWPRDIAVNLNGGWFRGWSV